MRYNTNWHFQDNLNIKGFNDFVSGLIAMKLWFNTKTNIGGLGI